MNFTVVTLFQDLIESFAACGLIGQAVSRGHLSISALNPRQFTTDIHQTVDDRVFGGGDGMVMKVEPLVAAVESLRAAGPCRVVVLSPQGVVWNQALARDYSLCKERVVLVCGRYGGIDHRFTAAYADQEVSIGDYVLNGGELAACVMIESVARLLPGVLGNQLSNVRDSFTTPLLEAPQFTRPQEILGMRVPAPLLTGHHANIEKFERTVARVRTALLRPDLLPRQHIAPVELQLLLQLTETELKALGIRRSQLEPWQ